MNPGAGSGFKARYDLRPIFNRGGESQNFADHYATKGKAVAAIVSFLRQRAHVSVTRPEPNADGATTVY
jgi:hypothetical protein